MAIPPADRKMMLATFRAQISGIVKEVPAKLKFVFMGEAFAFTRPSPTVSCHQGTKSEIAIKTTIVKPPAKPNQFILLRIIITYYATMGTFRFTCSGVSMVIPLTSMAIFTKSILILLASACSVLKWDSAASVHVKTTVMIVVRSGFS